jgi:REP element-mobilizing transposase RayT
MSHTYTSTRIQVIFSTKERKEIVRPEPQPKFWAYIAGIARNHKFEAIRVGGAEEHCHVLFLLPASLPQRRFKP